MKNRIFLTLPLFFLIFSLSLQSCEENRHLTEGIHDETVKDHPQAYNIYSGQSLSEAPEDHKVSSTFSSFSTDGFSTKEGKILSKSIDTKISALGKHWQAQQSVFSAFRNPQFNFYSYDNGMELLVVKYSANGGEQKQFFSCHNHSNEKTNDEPPVIIQVNCKGHCVEEIQDCTEVYNVNTGHVWCSCQSDECYMEFTTL